MGGLGRGAEGWRGEFEVGGEEKRGFEKESYLSMGFEFDYKHGNHSDI